MKKVAALLMMLACGSAIAAPATCEEIAKFTAGLATARQSGVPLSEVLKILGKNGVSNNMALAIYSQPQYHTEEMQKRAIVEAENSALIGCLKGSANK